MANLFKVIATKEMKNFLADLTGAVKEGVSLTPDQGKLKMGQLLYRDKTSGMYTPATSAQMDGSYSLAVLGEDVDTTGTQGEGGMVAEDGVAWTRACFCENVVFLKNGSSTAELSDADKLVLRQQGITFKPVVGVGVFNNAVPVAVTGVTVAPTTKSIVAGATAQLTATIAPENATDKKITWTSSAESYATVDENGLVTGVAAGSATITATTHDGSFTATCAVTVTAA